MSGTAAHNQTTEFGTGFQITRLHLRTDGLIDWERAPGPHNRTPFRPTPPWFGRRAQAASTAHFRFATPVTDTEAQRVWTVTGRRSIAQVLLEQDDPALQLCEAFSNIGAALRRLHDLPATHEATRAGPAPGPARLAAWLATGRGPRAAGGFRHRLRTGLGPERWDKLQHMTALCMAPGPAPVALHGWPSLGSLVLPDDDDRLPVCIALSGAEAAYGRRELDLGCVIGELIEFRMVAERDDARRPVLNRLRDQLLAGYGQGWDATALAAGAVVRLATHAHDFSAYIGWHPDLHLYLPMLADLLDSDGSPALPPIPEERLERP